MYWTLLVAEYPTHLEKATTATRFATCALSDAQLRVPAPVVYYESSAFPYCARRCSSALCVHRSRLLRTSVGAQSHQCGLRGGGSDRLASRR